MGLGGSTPTPLNWPNQTELQSFIPASIIESSRVNCLELSELRAGMIGQGGSGQLGSGLVGGGLTYLPDLLNISCSTSTSPSAAHHLHHQSCKPCNQSDLSCCQGRVTWWDRSRDLSKT